MNQFVDYKKIQAFKTCRTAMLKGVNYAHVVAPFLYDKSVLGFFKKLMFSLFFSTRVTMHESKGNALLLYYSCRHKRRADYDYIPQRLRELLGTRCEYFESLERFSFVQALHTLKKIPEAWRCADGYRVNYFHRLGCALLIAKYSSTAERVFLPFLQDKRRLVTFCDAQAPENLLAQMANFSGIETFTTQHGQYRILEACNISSDAEVYENFVSNYIFCWGEATRKDFVRVGFKPEQFIITGWIKQWTSVASHSQLGVFGVMLNGENGRESNAELLKAAKSVAGSLNLSYLVRLHPWSKPKQYAEFLDHRCSGIGHYGLSSYLGQVDFSLAHMTGASIEMLYSSAPIYLLDDGKLADAFRVNGLSYSTPDTIAAAVFKDMQFPDLARKRIQSLSKWFNDDNAQAARICAALLDERN